MLFNEIYLDNNALIEVYLVSWTQWRLYEGLGGIKPLKDDSWRISNDAVIENKEFIRHL